MLQIDNVINNIGNYFHHLSNINYIRLLDTPHAWGAPFGKEIMQQSYYGKRSLQGQ